MRPPTKRQLEVLRFIDEFEREHRYAPSYFDLCEALGIASKMGVSDHLRAMRKKGIVDLRPGSNRTVHVTAKGLAELQKESEES